MRKTKTKTAIGRLKCNQKVFSPHLRNQRARRSRAQLILPFPQNAFSRFYSLLLSGKAQLICFDKLQVHHPGAVQFKARDLLFGIARDMNVVHEPEIVEQVVIPT